MAIQLQAKILSKEEIDIFKEKIQHLLSNKGVKIEHPQVLEILKNAGAKIDASTSTVCFPEALIEEALNKVPASFTLAGIDPKHDLLFPHPDGLFYTRTCTGGMNYCAENGEYHNIKLAEVEEFTRLSDCLENIHFCSLPSTSPKDVPAETVDIHTLNAVFKNTTKHVWLQPYETKNIKYLIEMASILVGGKEQLRNRPIVSFISCSNTPFTFKNMDMEVILQSCNYGIPIQACSLPTSGANAPVTVPGVVLMACAEVMAMVVIAQSIAPGTPVIATPLLFAMDMMSTYTLQSPVEVTMGRMAAVQLFVDGYGIPAHTYGTGTDSFVLDGQSMIERTSISQMVALSGADVLGGAGQIEVAKTISPIQLIIDNEIFEMVKRLKAGFVVDDEMLGWNEIMGLTGREAFVAMEHTFRHFRDIYRPAVFARESRQAWVEKGSKDLIDRANDIYQSIKNRYEPLSMTPEIMREMDQVVKSADEEMVYKK